jgi:hypothetical protein
VAADLVEPTAVIGRQEAERRGAGQRLRQERRVKSSGVAGATRAPSLTTICRVRASPSAAAKR